jgi:hypothetical protein
LGQARAYNDQVGLPGLRWRPRTCPSEQRCLAELTPDDALDLLDELV